MEAIGEVTEDSEQNSEVPKFDSEDCKQVTEYISLDTEALNFVWDFIEPKPKIQNPILNF